MWRHAWVTLLTWGTGLLMVSSVLATLLGMFGNRMTGRLGRVVTFLAPAIVDVSAWYRVFEESGPGTAVYVGCDLRDGTYVGGYLDWYSTDVAETADRDFVLGAPLTTRKGGKSSELPGFQRVVLSAREVERMYVAYVKREAVWPRSAS